MDTPRETPYELRYARPDEFPAVLDLDGANFGIDYTGDNAAEDAALDVDLDRMLVAIAPDATMVGVSAEVAMPLAMPGGADVPVTGITWVSVDVLHRRRGVLRALIERQVRDHAAAGDVAADVLVASEAGIYGRYGYGIATRTRRTVIERRRTRLTVPADLSDVRRLPPAEAMDVLPPLYDRWRAVTPGAVGRPDDRWRHALLDRPYARDGSGPLQHLVHPDGYVTYRVAMHWGDGDPAHKLTVTDYAPVTAEAHAALWQVLLSMDLVGTIESFRIPEDDPLALIVTDSRRVETHHIGDGLWVRPVDVPRLLAARSYGVEVDVVLAITDRVLGDGTYRLVGGPDGATCERCDRPPQLHLDVADLGAVSLGGSRVSALSRVGRAQCDDPHLLARVDRAFLADRPPAHGSQI